LDPGRRRTGIALSDPTGRLASPLETVELPLSRLVRHIRTLIEQHAVVEVVIGYPRLPSGEAGEIAALAEKIADHLRRTGTVAVALWDEALSSWEAERLLATGGDAGGKVPPRGRGARRAREKGAVDRLAAALILQDYLDDRAGRRRTLSAEPPEQQGKGRQDG
jgi:putative Holliday junction resolvase